MFTDMSRLRNKSIGIPEWDRRKVGDDGLCGCCKMLRSIDGSEFGEGYVVYTSQQ